MTLGDVLRNLSDEGLAEVFAENCTIASRFAKDGVACEHTKKEAWEKWLKEEFKVAETVGAELRARINELERTE